MPRISVMKLTRTSVGVAITLVLVASVAPAHAAKLTGGTGPDVVFGTARADILSGGDANDSLFGKGNSHRKRKKRIDHLSGGSGIDSLLGGVGKDVTSGGDGADLIFDGDGAVGDRMFGGNDDDVFYAADGARDAIDCGAGSDDVIADPIDVITGCELVVGETKLGISVGNIPRDIRFGTAGDDGALNGTFGGTDVIFGLAGADTINLSNGAFQVGDGGTGVDSVTGGDSLDTLIDDDGTPGDTLNAGAAQDLILAADGAVTNIDCGFELTPIADIVFADPVDVLSNCEADTVVTGDGTIG